MISASLTLAAEPEKFQIDPAVGQLLENYCIDCHEEGTEKGKFRMDNLADLPSDARLDAMNLMHEKVHFEEMPPKKKDQPTEQERKKLEDWLAGILHANNASKLEDKLRMADYGNKVDHDKLFSGKYKDLPGYTTDRRWLISEYIYDAKMNKLLEFVAQADIDGKRQSILGNNNRNGVKVNLTNPFLLPTHSGVRYYDTTTLDGGHLLTMLTNAKELSAYMISRAKNKTYLPAIHTIMGAEWEHEKILLDRESYLNANIGPLLVELYKDKHNMLLPRFVATKPAPPAATGPDGKPLNKPDFDTAAPARDVLDQIWAAVRRNSQNGKMEEAQIVKTEREWFNFGVNERDMLVRVNFMRSYMEDLFKRMPKPNTNVPKPPAEAELAVMRAALLKHRKAGDTYSAVIAKCMTEWSDGFRSEREKASTTDEMIGKLVDQLFTKIIERTPTSQEQAEYAALTKSYIQKIGSEKAIDKLIQTIILRTDFVYREEFGTGPADEHGRKMLSPRDASYALAYALTDSSPDKERFFVVNA